MATAAKTAFSPPPPGVAWFGGGGWETVVLAGFLSAFAGLIIGIIVAMMYLAISIPMSKVSEAFSRSRETKL